MTDVSQEISDYQNTLMRQQDEFSIVHLKILELKRKIIDLRAEISPLEIAQHQVEQNIKKTRIQLRMSENIFWKNKQGL